MARELRRLAGGVAVAAMVVAGCSSAEVIGAAGGSMVVAVRATGEAVDTAFTLYINTDTTGYAVTTGAARSFSAQEGTHSLHLKGVEGNCTVAGDNPRSVVVGAYEIVNVTFDVSCTDNAELKVTISTTGEDQDDMYTLAFDGDYRTMLVGPSQFVLVSLPLRTYSVSLRDVASNCSVTSPNPVEVTLAKGKTVETGFQVACRKR